MLSIENKNNILTHKFALTFFRLSLNDFPLRTYRRTPENNHILFNCLSLPLVRVRFYSLPDTTEHVLSFRSRKVIILASYIVHFKLRVISTIFVYARVYV